MTDGGVRSVDAFCVDAGGVVHGVFPAGAHVFPVGAAEVAELDAAVRAAEAHRWVVTGPTIDEPLPSRIGVLERYVRERLPEFVEALMAQQSTAVPGVPGLELPVVVQMTLARAMARIEAFEELGAPEPLLAAARGFAMEVGTRGWRPVVDPGMLLPDPVQTAAAVDDGGGLVVADVSQLVLLAALCTVGPAARSVPAADPALRWHRLGGAALGDAASGDAASGNAASGDAVDDEPGVPGAVVVGLAVSDESVDRLDYALATDGGALLAVTLPAA